MTNGPKTPTPWNRCAGSTPRRQADRNRILFYAVPASLETSSHRALVCHAFVGELIRRYAAGILSGIEATLLHRPFVALVFVLRLPGLILALLRVDENIRTARRRLGGGRAVVGRPHDFVLA